MICIFSFSYRRCPYSLAQALALDVSKKLANSLAQKYHPTISNGDNNSHQLGMKFFQLQFSNVSLTNSLIE